MPDPRMIPADDARVTIEASGHVSSDGYSWPDNYVLDLAHTVIEQAAQIERVRKALLQMEDYSAQAQYEWDTKADMLAQGAGMGYSMSAQWLEEALGDTDD